MLINLLFFIIYLFIYLFLAALGLHCCVQAFSSCGEQGLLFIAVHRLLIAVASLVAEHGLQMRGLQQLWLTGSRSQAQQLWHTGLVVPWHVGSSWTRARTSVPCIGRRILNHCATREALRWVFVAVHGLSLVAASGGFSSFAWVSHCSGFSLWSTGSRHAGFSSCGSQPQQLWHMGSVVVACELSCSAACGIFLDQGSNLCPLHWQVDS